MFNVYTEFQQLKSIAVGNINSNTDLLEALPVLGKSHKKDLEQLFDETRQDFDKIGLALNTVGVSVHFCKTYNISQTPVQTLPLAPRDWFLVYGEDIYIPHPFFDCHQMRARSLDNIFDRGKTTRWFGDVGKFESTDDTMDVQSVYFDSANFLRCGKDIFYTKHFNKNGSAYGLQTVCRSILNKYPDVKFHEVDTEGHLDGSLFLVRPGLLLTTLKKLPKCFDNWDKIFVGNKRKKFNKDGFNYKTLHPMLVKEWHWFKESNPDETAFSINALSINENQVMFAGFNEYVFNELEKRKVECFDLNLSTCDFWDGGLHCFTNELCRQGRLEDYF